MVAVRELLQGRLQLHFKMVRMQHIFGVVFMQLTAQRAL